MEDPDRQWQIYELLSGTLQHYHARWVDNYRVFLSFNAILLPGSTALLGFAIKESQKELFLFVSILAVIGIITTVCGIGLMQRIRMDTDLRLNQLKRAEDGLKELTVKPFTEGYNVFIKKVEIKDSAGNVLLDKRKFSKWNLRASSAYNIVSWSIVVVYISLIAVSLYKYAYWKAAC